MAGRSHSLETKTFENWFEDKDIVIHLQWVDGVPFVHLGLNKWSVTIAYRVLDLKEKLCADLYSRGILYLSAYNPLPDAKWRKLVRLFGFTESYIYNNEQVFFTSTRPCQ